MNALPQEPLLVVDPDSNVDLSGITQVSVWEAGDQTPKTVEVELKEDEGTQKIFEKS